MKLRPLDNPPNPYLTQQAEWLEPPPDARIEVFEETAASILIKNNSPDLSFTWSVNPYRGCQHACAYCYARRYHEYLGYGAGTDFDTKLVAKVNAPELLDKALSKRAWARECIAFSGITDCYQPIEANYQLTRRCLEVCLRHGNPVGVVTKSFLVVRDMDLFVELNRSTQALVFMSIPFASQEHSKLIEPQAAAPSRRFEAVRRLSEAGVPVGVLVAPLIPGLNDQEIPTILKQAAEAGARTAGYTPLRLAGNVREVFLSRLREAIPMRAERVINRIRDMRRGKLNESEFGERMHGHGPYWESMRSLFAVHCERNGLNREGMRQLPAPDPHEPLIELNHIDAAQQKLVQLSFDFGDGARSRKKRSRP